MKRRKFIRQVVVTTASGLISPVITKAALNSASEAAIDVSAEGKTLKHYWSKCVGAGRAQEGLRASWQEQLATAKKYCGFTYCRFHGIFHDDMFVYREESGHPAFNWQYIDDLFDRMLQVGVRPFVELSFVPKQLASTPNTAFWWKGNSTPPNNYKKWAELVSAFTKHCIDRYGLNEVKMWYFEVWNEPDLHIFWDGTKSQYMELYKVSVNAIKAIDPDLRVGGPATSNFVPDGRFDGETEDKSKHKTFTVDDINSLEWRGVWIQDFLSYCSKEKLPVDFVSTHPYPTDWAIDPETKKGGGRVRKTGSLKDDLQWLKRTVEESDYHHAEIHCTEWSSSPSPRDPMHDSLPAATYVIKANIESIGLADSLSYWTFTDVFEEGGAGSSIFHGGFGLINYQGIVKPTFHAYRMLNGLGNKIIYQGDGYIITKHSGTGKITALAYHYPASRKDVVAGGVESLLDFGDPRTFAFKLTNLRPHAKLKLDLMDMDHGFVYMDWKRMGKPEPPTREQTESLKKAGMQTKITFVNAGSKGNFDFRQELTPWACLLIDEL
jgi:xylan 1,4-beta-xylosidase